MLVQRALAGPGRPLDESDQMIYGHRFGQGLGDVRLHTDGSAAEAARALRAHAFTSGHDIAFGESEYQPREAKGRRLIAHELAHVIQQTSRGPTGGGRIQRQADSLVSGDQLDDENDEAQVSDLGPSSDESNTEEWDASNISGIQMARWAGSEGVSTDVGLEAEADAAAEAVTSGRAFSIARLARPLRAVTRKPKPRAPRIPQTCGRPSARVADYPSTHISDVNVDVTSPNHSVKLVWAGPGAASGPAGPYHSSPGAGTCGLDCNDTKTSQTSGTHCTPKDGSWPVDYTACAMGSYPDARNVVYFQRGGIALHYYPSVPDYPASHGCVRIESVLASRLIHDNCVPGTTMVNVSGSWKRGTDPKSGKPVCW